MDDERMQRVLNRLGDDSNPHDVEYVSGMIDKIYNKFLENKDGLYFIILNDKKYKIVSLQPMGNLEAIQIVLENNICMIFDDTNIDFFMRYAIMAVYQPFMV